MIAVEPRMGRGRARRFRAFVDHAMEGYDQGVVRDVNRRPCTISAAMTGGQIHKYYQHNHSSKIVDLSRFSRLEIELVQRAIQEVPAGPRVQIL